MVEFFSLSGVFRVAPEHRALDVSLRYSLYKLKRTNYEGKVEGEIRLAPRTGLPLSSEVLYNKSNMGRNAIGFRSVRRFSLLQLSRRRDVERRRGLSAHHAVFRWCRLMVKCWRIRQWCGTVFPVFLFRYCSNWIVSSICSPVFPSVGMGEPIRIYLSIVASKRTSCTEEHAPPQIEDAVAVAE